MPIISLLFLIDKLNLLRVILCCWFLFQNVHQDLFTKLSKIKREHFDDLKLEKRNTDMSKKLLPQEDHMEDIFMENKLGIIGSHILPSETNSYFNSLIPNNNSYDKP